jgi:cysteinyl-tRNA synthetase
VLDALADDLNTPKAIAALHDLAAKGQGGRLRASAALLGLLGDDLGGWDAAPEADADTAARIDALLAARAAARQDRDFARADAIRAGLDAAGVTVMDRPGAASDWELTAAFAPEKLAELEA